MTSLLDHAQAIARMVEAGYPREEALRWSLVMNGIEVGRASELERFIRGVEAARPSNETAESYEAPVRKRRSGLQPKRRFTDHAELDPENVAGLPADHPAVVEGRTLFPSTVVEAEDSPRLLVSGQNHRKLGDRVVKGPWKGMPIYSLTLEERATCPKSCHVYAACYGNGMPLARRHRHGPELEGRLAAELAEKQDQHPRGFVVRLHMLGDFYSVDYVRRWAAWLELFPALHVFGYTAWQPGTEIGDAIAKLREARWDRFAIRFSSAEPMPGGATTLWRKPNGPVEPEGIVCPAQTDRTDCCGSCGLCWHPAAKDKTIVFVAHGRTFKPEPEAAPKPKRTRARPQSSPEREAAVLAALRERLPEGEGFVGWTDLMRATKCGPSLLSVVMEALEGQGAIRRDMDGTRLRYTLLDRGEDPPADVGIAITDEPAEVDAEPAAVGDLGSTEPVDEPAIAEPLPEPPLVPRRLPDPPDGMDRLSASERAVLTAIAELLAGKPGNLWTEDIARKAELPENSAWQHILALARMGAIDRDGDRVSSMYRLLVEIERRGEAA